MQDFWLEGWGAGGGGGGAGGVYLCINEALGIGGPQTSRGGGTDPFVHQRRTGIGGIPPPQPPPPPENTIKFFGG